MNRPTTQLAFCIFLLVAAPAWAGFLDGDPAAFNDGINPIWSGHTDYQGYDAFNNPTYLHGHVDWAVYAPGAHLPAFFGGYTPTPGEMIYTYQAFETGVLAGDPPVLHDAPLSLVEIGVENYADNIGTFSNGLVSGIAPTSSILDLPNQVADWHFTGINQPDSSTGLIFSSPLLPMMDVGLTQDDGSIGYLIPVPSTSPFRAPEPGTLALASSGLLVLAFQWLRRRGRRAAI